MTSCYGCGHDTHPDPLGARCDACGLLEVAIYPRPPKTDAQRARECLQREWEGSA